MESNDSPEIPDRGETSDIAGRPSGALATVKRDSVHLLSLISFALPSFLTLPIMVKENNSYQGHITLLQLSPVNYKFKKKKKKEEDLEETTSISSHEERRQLIFNGKG